MTNPSAPPQDTAPEAPRWLDEIEGEQALDWVRERNAATETELGGPHLAHLEARLREVLDSPDRIPFVSVRGEWAFNFWTDGEHPRGLWRRQLLDSYLEGGEEWDVLVDVDALSAAEGRSWVWHGATVLYPDRDRALIDLSEGGSDADTTREFDLRTRSWVEDGFIRPAAKGSMSWIDRDSVWVMTDVGQGSTSTSGYPLQARLLRRGGSLDAAPTVISGEPQDLAVGAHHDHTPGFERSWAEVAHDFHHSTTYLLRGDPSEGGDPLAPQALDVPSSAEVGAWREWLFVSLRKDWELEDRTWPGGSLLAFELEEFLAGGRHVHPLLVPDGHTFLETFTLTRHHMVMTLLSDVRSRLRVATPPTVRRGEASGGSGIPSTGSGMATGSGAGATEADARRAGSADTWIIHDLDLGDTDVPALATVSAGAVAPLEDDRLWLTVSGFTTPTTLFLLDLDEGGRITSSRAVRHAPALFDASGVEVSQHFATSTDGTQVPYFQVGRPGGNPTAPTLLYGYGGFEVSLLPHYAPGVGRALLEQGGTYVVANIRGGGEYGPAWHRAALRQNRHRAYQDFAAVARDLVARGVTTPSRLGIQGGSNGGMLTGNMLVRDPELFGAVVIQVPLLDMRRYHTLLAGASWMSEYGDPDDPEQWEWLQDYSPFHLWDPARAYPPVLLTTSTRDDRVHPAHARTMAWRMVEGRADVLYFENIEGGHAGAADNAQRAHVQALVWEFLWRRLGD